MLTPMVERLKKQYLDGENQWYSLRWHYIESCILKGYLDSYEQTGNEEDHQFVKQFIDRLYDEGGTIPEIDLDYFSIDQIRMASILFALYAKEKDPKYKNVLDQLYTQLTTTYPRTESGNF